MRITIGETGGVTRAKVTGFGHVRLDECVRSHALTWRFPPPKDEDGETMTVNMVMSFAMLSP